jgi:phospholipid/cholesterol/gamma-HCH transport system substrate-binding protein
MASTKTKFAVGLFVLGGVSIALLGIIWLGVTRYFEKGHYYATYFNESVQGLDKDSPVKYRGVSIGRVAKIGVAPDEKLIEVVLKVESEQKLGSDMEAQLKSVGITGSMFIELDQKKEGEPDRSPPLNFPTKYPVVASKPSTISELFHGIDKVLTQFSTLDLEGISDALKSTMGSLNHAIIDANVKAISTNLESSIERFDTQILGRVESTRISQVSE